MKRRLVFATLISAAAVPVQAAIALPEHLYYKFDEGSGLSTANLASPGSGAASATLFGGAVMTGPGFAGNGLSSAGGVGSVNTGWNTNIGTSSWTIATWISPLGTASTTLNYWFGDGGAANFRCFTGGVAGAQEVTLRGAGATDTTISGLSLTANNHVAFVYDNTQNTIKGYLNGTLATTVSQGVVTLTGTGFRVGNRNANSTSSSILPGRWMDEFQVYGRALSENDLQSAMSGSFVPEPGTMAVLGLGAAALLRRRRKGQPTMDTGLGEAATE